MKYSKELYDREVLIKSCYAFTDQAYIHLSSDDRYYFVDIISKDSEGFPEQLEKKLENEMIFQQARKMISHNTKSVREMIVARALASTIVNDENETHAKTEQSFSADNILKDWFGEHE